MGDKPKSPLNKSSDGLKSSNGLGSNNSSSTTVDTSPASISSTTSVGKSSGGFLGLFGGRKDKDNGDRGRKNSAPDRPANASAAERKASHGDTGSLLQPHPNALNAQRKQVSEADAAMRVTPLGSTAKGMTDPAMPTSARDSSGGAKDRAGAASPPQPSSARAILTTSKRGLCLCFVCFATFRYSIVLRCTRSIQHVTYRCCPFFSFSFRFAGTNAKGSPPPASVLATSAPSNSNLNGGAQVAVSPMSSPRSPRGSGASDMLPPLNAKCFAVGIPDLFARCFRFAFPWLGQ
jgi:hypothetical protein